MKPTSAQLIESVAWSLDNKVAPHITDKWGASTLRSVSCLLEHLTARVEGEGQILFDDNADLDALAQELSEKLVSVGNAAAAALAALTNACDQQWRDVDEYPTIGSLSEENAAKQGALDLLIAALPNTDDTIQPAVDAIDAYLARHLERERPLFSPAFMKPTF